MHQHHRFISLFLFFFFSSIPAYISVGNFQRERRNRSARNRRRIRSCFHHQHLVKKGRVRCQNALTFILFFLLIFSRAPRHIASAWEIIGTSTHTCIHILCKSECFLASSICCIRKKNAASQNFYACSERRLDVLPRVTIVYTAYTYMKQWPESYRRGAHRRCAPWKKTTR